MIAAFFGEGPGVRITAEVEPEVANFASSRAETKFLPSSDQ
jgi:hypothetical protein